MNFRWTLTRGSWFCVVLNDIKALVKKWTRTYGFIYLNMCIRTKKKDIDAQRAIYMQTYV